MSLRRNVLDFWGRLETDKSANNVYLQLRAKYLICIKKTYNSLETLTSFATARSNFVTANKKNWIFLIEQISPLALLPARSGKEIPCWPEIKRRSSKGYKIIFTSDNNVIFYLQIIFYTQVCFTMFIWELIRIIRYWYNFFTAFFPFSFLYRHQTC